MTLREQMKQVQQTREETQREQDRLKSVLSRGEWTALLLSENVPEISRRLSEIERRIEQCLEFAAPSQLWW